MSKNRRLSSAILDGGFFEFRRQLEYKATWYGAQVIVADRFFPSSKMYSNCGHIKQELKLKDRVYHCLECNLTLDRDFNASTNLENYDENSSVSYTENSFKQSKSPVKNYTNQRVIKLNGFNETGSKLETYFISFYKFCVTVLKSAAPLDELNIVI